MEKLTFKEQVVLQKLKEFLAYNQKITIRHLQDALWYASPRSISVLLEQLMNKGYVYRDVRAELRIAPVLSQDSITVKNIPLIGAIACGMPIFAEENIETEIPVSNKLLQQSKQYFFLRARGDSMDQKGIEDGDLVLIEQTNSAINGQIVVALINDEATLKELQVRDGTAFLIPHSHNPKHKPIILDDTWESLNIQGVFIKSFPGSLFS
jgi:repressor LexA